MLLRTLLGKKNLEFSISCLKSVVDNSVVDVQLEIFEDGSLVEEEIQSLENNIKNSKVIKKTIRDEVIKRKLNQYENCMSFRNKNVLAMKLFDTMLFDEKPFFL